MTTSIDEILDRLAVAHGQLDDALAGEPHMPPPHVLQEAVDDLADQLSEALEWDRLDCLDGVRRLAYR